MGLKKKDEKEENLWCFYVMGKFSLTKKLIFSMNDELDAKIYILAIDQFCNKTLNIDTS